jgi:hypothetical protein
MPTPPTLPITMTPEAAYSMAIASNIIERIRKEAKRRGHDIILHGDYRHELARGVLRTRNNEELFETVLAWLASDCVKYTVGRRMGAVVEFEATLPDLSRRLALAGVAPHDA